jgi:excisionase family DNA binding protein
MKKSEASVELQPSSLYLLDIPTAAKLLSSNTWALRKLLQSGEIPYLNIGHKWLVSHEAIRAFIRRRENAFRERNGSQIEVGL